MGVSRALTLRAFSDALATSAAERAMGMAPLAEELLII
jgi:hypothetical protein